MDAREQLREDFATWESESLDYAIWFYLVLSVVVVLALFIVVICICRCLANKRRGRGFDAIHYDEEGDDKDDDTSLATTPSAPLDDSSGLVLSKEVVESIRRNLRPIPSRTPTIDGSSGRILPNGKPKTSPKNSLV